MGVTRTQRLPEWLAILGYIGGCIGLTMLGAGCGRQPTGYSGAHAARADPSKQVRYASEAKRAMGEGAQVILSGDLAHDGHIQLLVANRLPEDAARARSAVSVSRAAVLERDGDQWREVFLADDHLKNEMGFLQGAPAGSVSSWRLRYSEGADGLTMDFTPMQQPTGSARAPIEVRWNPGSRRYQSFDRRSGSFLTEISMPEGTPSYVIKR
jgi:hypothetical protein